MPGCTVPSCRNSTQKGFKLYHFPSDSERCAMWVQNCGREDGWNPTQNTCICEVHFEESQFELHRADGLKKLKPYAVPTIFNTATPTICGKRKKRKTEPENDIQLLELQKRSRQSKKEKNVAAISSDVTPNASKTRKEYQSASEASTCYICNSRNKNMVPNNACTETSKTRLKQKLVQLVSVEFDLLVQDIGVICINCAQILNCIDYIENIHYTLSKGIINHLKPKFCMEPSEHVNLKQFMKSLKNLTVFCPGTNSEGLHLPDHLSSKKENVFVKSEKQHSHQPDKSSEVVGQFSETLNEDNNIESQDSVSLENRLENVTTANNFECELCSFATRYRALMIFHLRQHFQRYYTCDFCTTPVAFDPAKEIQTSDTSCKIREDSVCKNDKPNEIPLSQLSRPQTNYHQHSSDSSQKGNVKMTKKCKGVIAQESHRNVKRNNISQKFEDDCQSLTLNFKGKQQNLM